MYIFQNNLFHLSVKIIWSKVAVTSRGVLEPSQTSKMAFFVEILSSFEKSSILDV